MTPVRIFHRYRGLRNFTLRSLLAAACELIPSLIASQSRYKVSELPTERTLRFYMSQGLMDKPAGKRGTASLYTYRHLLQLLAVKHLQSQYLPLRRIKTVLRGASNRELEGLLPGGRRGTGKAAVMDHPSAAPGRAVRREGAPAEKRTGQDRWVRVAINENAELLLRENGLRAPLSSDELEACRRAVASALEDCRDDE